MSYVYRIVYTKRRYSRVQRRLEAAGELVGDVGVEQRAAAGGLIGDGGCSAAQRGVDVEAAVFGVR